MENKDNEKLEESYKKGDNNMNAVLSLDKYLNCGIIKRNNKNKRCDKKNTCYTNKDISAIYDLETRHSGADEFPHLWDNGED